MNSPKNGESVLREELRILSVLSIQNVFGITNLQANECLLEIALIIYSKMLNHKVIEQYLTKQPRWSSDVIKAPHQEALLLGAVSRSCLLFSIHFREQASAVWFHIIQTCLN